MIDVNENALGGLLGHAGAEVCWSGGSSAAQCTPEGCVCPEGFEGDGLDDEYHDYGTGCDEVSPLALELNLTLWLLLQSHEDKPRCTPPPRIF